MGSASTVLFLAPTALQLLVLLFLYRRRSYIAFPAFASYCALQVASGIFLVAARQTSSDLAYYYGYWASVAFTLIASFAVWLEILSAWLAPFEIARGRALLLFSAWGCVALIFASVVALGAGSSRDPRDVITNTIMLLQRNLFLVECGMMALLMVFRKRLGISGRDLIFGIALGFTIIAAASIAITSALSVPTVIRHSTLRLLLSSTQAIACLVWLLYAIAGKSHNPALTSSLP